MAFKAPAQQLINAAFWWKKGCINTESDAKSLLTKKKNNLTINTLISSSEISSLLTVSL